MSQNAPTKPSVSSRIAWNTITKWISSLIAAVVAFILVDYQAAKLGAGGFGAVSLLMSVVFFMLLCDAGLRPALGRHLAEQAAREDGKRFSELFNSALAFLLALGALFAVICMVAAGPLVKLMNFAVDQQPEATVLVRYYVSISIIVCLIGPAFGAVIEAHNRFDLVDYGHIVEVLVRFGGMFVGIGALGLGLYGWAMAMLLSQVVALAINVFVAFRISPYLRLGWDYLKRDALMESLRLGRLVMLYHGMPQLNALMDRFIIAQFLTSDGTAFYHPAQLAVASAYPFVGGLSRQLRSLASGYDALGNQGMLQEMLVRGTRLTILLSIPFCVILGCFAGPIVGLWLELPKYEPTVWALIILSLADVSTHVRETQGFVMTGLNRVRFITLTQVIGGATTIVLGIGVTALLVYYGLGFNAIIGVAIPAAVVGWLQAAVISVYVARATGVGGRRYFKESFLWPLVCLVISTLGALAISRTFQPHTWAGLIACAALTGTLCTVVGWTVGFDQIDRQRVLQMVNRLIGLVRRRAT